MDNQKGGQSSASVPSGNAWGQAAAANAAHNQQQADANRVSMSSLEKQRETATELARKRLLEAYASNGQSGSTAATPEKKEPSKTVAQHSDVPKINTADWKKYHSAWQSYYQKYYGEYYGRAAKEYVAREKMKLERDAADRARSGEEAEAPRTATTATVAHGKSTAIVSTPMEDQATAEDQKSFKSKIQKKVAKRAKKLRKSHHFVPIVIGLSILVLGLLWQYNQVIIANAVAFMSPGGSEVNDISAIDPTVSASVHSEPTLMIPKLNVEVPVIFGAKNDVKSMNVAMAGGVANFTAPGATAKPGEIGNFVISGHSAGNVYENSKYKFIFSGLTRMGEGDLIYMDYNSQRYTYRVKGTRTVDPSDVASLKQIADSNPGRPMITLITCTPLGTSKYRLLVYGEQIHPNYDKATSQSEASAEESSEEITMPKNEDPPLTQFWKWLTGQN